MERVPHRKEYPQLAGRGSDIRRQQARQRRCHIINPERRELIRDTISIFNMATAHDAD
jgi:hypothetical protein